jgi:sugar (pentulose or hexulose) kinase
MKNKLFAIAAGAVLALVGVQSPASADSPWYTSDPASIDCSDNSNNKYWTTVNETETKTWTDSRTLVVQERINSLNAAKAVYRTAHFDVLEEFTQILWTHTYELKICNNGKKLLSSEEGGPSSLSVRELSRTLTASFVENPGTAKR